MVVRGMPDFHRVIATVDRFQQRNRPVGFAYGVVKKFSDDRGGNLAALITYYGFVSLFPLLLVAVTVLGYVLHGNPDLQHRILDSALANFPVVGDQIQRNLTTVQGHGVALVVGVLFALYGGLGIADVAQQAMNRVWGVPMYRRPGFVPRIARSLGLIGTLGLGILVTTVLSGVGNRLAGTVVIGLAVSIAAVVANTALFVVAFQVLIAVKVPWRELLPGAVVAGVAWEVLQRVGTFYLSRVLQGMSEVYGLFAIVLGLLVWISLEARVILYAAEINAVRKQQLWPRSLAPPRTDADQRADLALLRDAEREAPQPLGADPVP